MWAEILWSWWVSITGITECRLADDPSCGGSGSSLWTSHLLSQSKIRNLSSQLRAAYRSEIRCVQHLQKDTLEWNVEITNSTLWTSQFPTRENQRKPAGCWRCCVRVRTLLLIDYLLLIIIIRQTGWGEHHRDVSLCSSGPTWTGLSTSAVFLRADWTTRSHPSSLTPQPLWRCLDSLQEFAVMTAVRRDLISKVF